MPVQSKSDNLKSMYKQWRIIEAVCHGDEATMSQDIARDIVLPLPSQKNDWERYRTYRQQVHMTEFAGDTLDRFLGEVQKSPPEVQDGDDQILDDDLLSMLSNIDGRGSTIDRFYSQIFERELCPSFGAVVVDMPTAEEMEAMITRNPKPYAYLVPAIDILGRKYETVGGVRTLTDVRWLSSVSAPAEDPWSELTIPTVERRYLADGGTVFFQRYQQGKKPDDWPLVAEGQIVARDGRPLEQIPVRIFNAGVDDGGKPKRPEIQRLVNLNIDHLRRQVDLHWSLHKNGVAQPWISGGVGGNFDLNPEAAWQLEPSGSTGYLYLPAEAIESNRSEIQDIEKRIILMGLYLAGIDRGQAESGDALRLRIGSQHSFLQKIIRSTADHCTWLVKTMAELNGRPRPEVRVTQHLDSQQVRGIGADIEALARGRAAGGYGSRVHYYNMQRVGSLPTGMSIEEFETDRMESLDAEIAAFAPANKNQGGE